MISAKWSLSVSVVDVHHRTRSTTMVAPYSIVTLWPWHDGHYSSKWCIRNSILAKEDTLDSSRYFYDELQQLADGRSPLRNIFVDPVTAKMHLRNNVSIHLVVSDAPNGDAKEFLPADTNAYLNAYDAVRASF
jgi:hypothetical protein